MSIYHICTGCDLNPINNPVIPCPARESPYDEFCINHDKFTHQMKQRMNKEYCSSRLNEMVK
jgi:hypothetical protein